MFSRLLTDLLVFFSSIACAAQTADLTGTIRDDRNEPLAGVSIQILNTSYEQTSNSEGRFTFEHLPSGKFILLVRMQGYAAQTIEVPPASASVNISLHKEDHELPEVVVTAQKRQEDQQRLPLSISTLSQRQIQENQLWNTRDLSAIIPNLYSSNPGDNRNVTSIRGIATTSYDQSIATYVDGVNQFGLDTYFAQLYDIERIEVLRGPQGTLYGRNAMGGVINVITKQPGNAVHGSAEVGYGNHGQARVVGAVRSPLVKNKLYMGIAGLYQGLGGFYKNEFTGASFDDQHVFSGNYSLKYLAAKNLTFDLNVKHSENRNAGTFPLVFSPEEAFRSAFSVNQNSTSTMVDNLFNSSFGMRYYGKKFNITSQTSYQSNYRYYQSPLDGDFSPADAVSIVNNYGDKWNKVNAFTQEIQISSAGDHALSWQAGAYGFIQDNPVKQGTHFGADAEMMGAPFPFFMSINTNSGKGTGMAIYGQAEYQLTWGLQMIAGIRLDRERKELKVRGEFQADGGDLLLTQPDTSAAAGFNAVSPKLGLRYALSEDHNFFATYSRGFRAGGITLLSSDPSQPPLNNYDPEFSDNYEVGVKNSFANNRLRLNIAAFYTRVKDAQVPTLILPEAITVIRNAGRLTSKGAEMELAAALLQRLQVDYSFGYTKAVYKTLDLASNGENINLSGNRQVFTPELTSMLGMQYRVDLPGKRKIHLITRAEWKHLGDQYFDMANRIKQNAYSLMNARVTLSMGHYALTVWSNNLGNKKYLDYAYDFGAAHLGNPHTYGISLTASF